MDKWIKIKGKGWAAKAIALGVPGRDVSITFAINKKMKQNEVDSARKEIESSIEEWFLDSKMLEPFHFIKEVIAPTTYKLNSDKEMNMVFVVNISVLSRKLIQIGTGEHSFDILFRGEIERLVEELGLG